MSTKPKLRMAPPPAVLAEQQSRAVDLLKLDEWTEEPHKAPLQPIKQKPATTIAPGHKIAPQVPLKPWDVSSAEAVHPYHLILPERLFQKMDYVWKRGGNKSMREWVLSKLEAEADKALKNLGKTK